MNRELDVKIAKSKLKAVAIQLAPEVTEWHLEDFDNDVSYQGWFHCITEEDAWKSYSPHYSSSIDRAWELFWEMANNGTFSDFEYLLRDDDPEQVALAICEEYVRFFGENDEQTNV